MGNLKKQFGLRIKELRQARGWTQEYLAEKLEMETQNISRMENGIHMPNSDRIERIADIFNVKINELFLFEHFTERKNLLKNIMTYLKEASDKDLQFLYKVILANKEK